MRTKVLVAVAVAASLVALADSSASAARSSRAASVGATSCPGGTVVSPVAARRLPAGSTAYDYRLPSGQTFTNLTAPADFTYATASNAQLAELNLPRRPAGAAATKRWAADVAPFGQAGARGPLSFCIQDVAGPGVNGTDQPAGMSSAASTGSVAPQASVGKTGSTDFAGYELQNGGYEKVVGHFSQPNSQTSTGRMSDWLGLNGHTWTSPGSHPADRLIQAGVDTLGQAFVEVYCSGGSSYGCFSATPEGSLKISPGNDISVSVSTNPITHTAYFALAVKGQTDFDLQVGLKAGPTGGTPVSGAVADFITERPSSVNLPSFTGLVFSSSRTYPLWDGDSSTPFSAQSYFAIEMASDNTFHTPPCSNSQKIMAFPNDITSGGFTENYCESS